jgi:hypothetical protein
MVVSSPLWSWVFYLFYKLTLPPFVFTLCMVLILASCGKSLGIRRLYVRTLIKIFEVSHQLFSKRFQHI